MYKSRHAWQLFSWVSTDLRLVTVKMRLYKTEWQAAIGCRSTSARSRQLLLALLTHQPSTDISRTLFWRTRVTRPNRSVHVYSLALLQCIRWRLATPRRNTMFRFASFRLQNVGGSRTKSHLKARTPIIVKQFTKPGLGIEPRPGW